MQKTLRLLAAFFATQQKNSIVFYQIFAYITVLYFLKMKRKPVKQKNR